LEEGSGGISCSVDSDPSLERELRRFFLLIFFSSLGIDMEKDEG
jgi:hypothetical protein